MNKLVIFDCDGVLVDSEILAHQGDVEALSSIGYSITLEESIRRFTGINDSDFRQIIFQESGVIISDDFFEKRKNELIKVFEMHLNSLVKIVLLKLNEMKIEKCVASSSPRERVVKALSLTDQLKFFSASSIFVSQQVQKGKPEPDLFLFAAEQMKSLPKNCIVVEDSVPGIKAAIAAKMNVVGFLGGSHTQYDWYEQIIKTYEIPVAKNSSELLEILNSLMTYS